jgi:GGDEF domain-containing protein
MTRTSRWSAVGAAVTVAMLGAGPAVWAGQEEQFTPEFKELRSVVDPKHTPKIVAPDTVKRGQWFEVTVSVGCALGTDDSVAVVVARADACLYQAKADEVMTDCHA